jgi:hypothetical protein
MKWSLYGVQYAFHIDISKSRSYRLLYTLNIDLLDSQNGIMADLIKLSNI